MSLGAVDDPEWVAERPLIATATGRNVMIRVGKPTKARSGEWTCSVQVTGIEQPETTYAFGEDSLQALLMGLSMVRARLESLKASHGLIWLGESDLGLDLV